MGSTMAVFRRELRGYLLSPIAYVVVAIFAGFVSWWFLKPGRFFLLGQANLEAMFTIVPWAFVFIVPAVTMRLWSEEFRGGTIETLMTFPVRSRSLVLGKFLAAWALLAIALLATLALPLTAAKLGDLDWGPVLGGYGGALAMGAAFLALGVYVSGRTQNQIVAFLVSVVLCLALVLLDVFSEDLGALQSIASQVSVSYHYHSLGRGVVDLRDVAYFATFVGFFLYLNTESIENRRVR